MTHDGFAPFVPRVVTRRCARARREDPVIAPPVVASPVYEVDAVADPAPSAVEAAPVPFMLDRADSVVQDDDERETVDAARNLTAIRERAIRIAGEACARALHEAVAKNPLFVARFVDDAIQASGLGTATVVRVSPRDAAACQGRTPVGVVADEGISPGEVIVETANGSVGATIGRRAQILVRSVAGG